LSDVREVLTTGIQFHKAMLLYIVSSQMDRFVVLTLWDNTTLGLYMVAFTIASSGLGLISQTFEVVLLPTISACTTEEERRAQFAQALRVAMLLLFLLTSVLAAASYWIIPLLFGAAFKPAFVPTIILLCAYLPFALRIVMIRGLRGFGESRTATISEAVTLTTFVAVSWPMGMFLHLNGIGLALLLANIIGVIPPLLYVSRRLHLPSKDWWGINAETARMLIRRGRLIYETAKG
jgi:O-antigen/teichoic acid export membrane protein